MLTIYADTDQVIEVPDVVDRDNAAQEDATVAMTFYRAGVAVGSALTGDHTESGTYEVFIEDGLGLEPAAKGITYKTTITLADGTTDTTLGGRVHVARRQGSR